MKSFDGCTLIRITSRTHPMAGACGKVMRRNYDPDGSAWVLMESDPPEACREFPIDANGGRGRWILLHPEDVAESQ